MKDDVREKRKLGETEVAPDGHLKQGDIPDNADEPGDEPIGQVPLYRNYKIVIPLFIVVGGLAILAWNWYMGMRDFISTDDAYIDGNRVAISSKILGRIDSLYINEGDTVHVGEILATLDATDLHAQETQAHTALTLAKDNVTLAKVSLDKAQSDFQRAAAQFKEGIIPKEQYDHAQSEAQSAQAKYDIAVAQVGQAKAQIGVIETQLGNTSIASPMNGVVSKRWALQGDVIQPGQPIFSVYDVANTWITANLEETRLGQLHLNDSVEISVDAYPDRKFTGTVYQIGSNTAAQFSLIPPNNASGNFTKITQRVPVKISIAQTAGQKTVQLLPGMSVEVKVKVR